MTVFLFQLKLALLTPRSVHVWVTAPLFGLVFLAVTEHAGRPDLAGHAVVAPTLIALWTLALQSAGEIITDERDNGTLEGLVAAPVPVVAVVFLRMLAATVCAVPAFAEVWLLSGVLFGRWVAVPHPALLAAALLVTAFTTATTAAVLSPLFVLLPSARIVQNTISYPFYLLGGVVVPVAVFPDWLEVISRITFLSWSSDLLRAALSPAPVTAGPLRLGVIALLGVLAAVLAAVLFGRVLDRVRSSGTLAHT